jgi:hypothetical protein
MSVLDAAHPIQVSRSAFTPSRPGPKYTSLSISSTMLICLE